MFLGFPDDLGLLSNEYFDYEISIIYEYFNILPDFIDLLHFRYT